MVGISQISQMLKSLHSDTKDGHALNSHLEILQTTSSRPYFLLSKNLMVGISQISRMLKSLHSDTNDGHALNSLHGILQTTSSKLYALLRLIIGKILPFRYQRWPWTKQPSWNSTNNIFPPIFLLEQKIDSSLQGKMETQNRLSHSIQISKMAIHYYSHHEILQTTSVSKPYVLMSRNLIGWIMPKRDSEMLVIPLRYQRWSCTEQPFWNFSNKLFQPIYSFEQILDGGGIVQHGEGIVQHGDSE